MNFGFYFTSPTFNTASQDDLESVVNPINNGTTFTNAQLTAAARTGFKIVDSNGDGWITDVDSNDTHGPFFNAYADHFILDGAKRTILELDRDGDQVSTITYNGTTLDRLDEPVLIYEIFLLDNGAHLVAFGQAALDMLATYSGGVFNPGLITGMRLDRTTNNDEGAIAASVFPNVVCFATGTLISTSRGEERAGDLRGGDLVHTADRDLQPIRWVGRRHLDAATLKANPNLQPIRIKAGALGQGLPDRDLVVSPQHRMLVDSEIARRISGEPQALVAAKHLLEYDGIDVADDLTEVTYVHFCCDQHEVVFAEGAPSESLYTGAEALKALSEAAREELETLFPALRNGGDPSNKPIPARVLLNSRTGRKLAYRHRKNNKPFLQSPVW